VVARAYQIFERMTSFFFTFFLGSNLGRIRSAFRAGGTRCPQRVGKANAALPPKFDVEQRFAGNAQKILPIRAVGFGIVPESVRGRSVR